ncbi:MAG: hypothetical protein C5B44_05650 [Acidobacteria bacterium]|nr:MAG: hypothetical protein C5B44_05650 [Acidobacteriota bacterium]
MAEAEFRFGAKVKHGCGFVAGVIVGPITLAEVEDRGIQKRNDRLRRRDFDDVIGWPILESSVCHNARPLKSCQQNHTHQATRNITKKLSICGLPLLTNQKLRQSHHSVKQKVKAHENT